MIPNLIPEEIRFKLTDRDAEISYLIILNNFMAVLEKAKQGNAFFLSPDTIDILFLVVSDKIKLLVTKLGVEVKEVTEYVQPK